MDVVFEVGRVEAGMYVERGGAKGEQIVKIAVTRVGWCKAMRKTMAPPQSWPPRMMLERERWEARAAMSSAARLKV